MPRRATGKPAPRSKKPAPQPEAPDRSEDDILLQRPIEVTLADKPYTIKLLPIRAQTEWRRKAVPLLSGFLSMSEVTSEKPEEFEKTLASILIDTPEQMLDLFFDYARDLDREEIENTATEAEVAVAFKKIMAVALPPPLLTALTGALTAAVR